MRSRNLVAVHSVKHLTKTTQPEGRSGNKQLFLSSQKPVSSINTLLMPGRCFPMQSLALASHYEEKQWRVLFPTAKKLQWYLWKSRKKRMFYCNHSFFTLIVYFREQQFFLERKSLRQRLHTQFESLNASHLICKNSLTQTTVSTATIDKNQTKHTKARLEYEKTRYLVSIWFYNAFLDAMGSMIWFSTFTEIVLCAIISWAKPWWQSSTEHIFSTLPWYKQCKPCTASRTIFRVRSSIWKQFLKLVLLKYKQHLTHSSLTQCQTAMLTPKNWEEPLMHRPHLIWHSFPSCFQVLSISWQKSWQSSCSVKKTSPSNTTKQDEQATTFSVNQVKDTYRYLCAIASALLI